MQDERENPNLLRDRVVGSTLVTVGFVAMVLLVRGPDLLHRQLWMDEVHTWVLVTDPDVGHSLAALAQGADFNPPTYYLILRGFLKICGEATPFRMRLFSVLMIAVGLGFAVMTLARGYGTAPAVAAASAVAVQPLVIQQCVEARFYATWFAGISMFCFARAVGRNTLIWLAVQSVLAAVVCTVHYFGVISLGLVFLGDVVARRRVADPYDTASPDAHSAPRQPARVVRFLAPYIAGGSALVGCLPFYFGQRASLTVATWIGVPTLQKVSEFLLMVTPGMLLVISLVLAGVFAKWSTRASAMQTARRLYVWPLMTMPLVIVVFSYTVQPAMVDRYVLVGLLGWTAVFAALLRRVPTGILIGVVVVCVAMGVDNLIGLNAHHQSLDKERSRVVDYLRTGDESAASPVVFEDRIEHFPAVLMTNFPGDWFLLDFARTPPGSQAALRAVQRDVGRAINRSYPQYRMRTTEQIAAESDSFILIPYKPRGAATDSEADEHRLRAEYPGFTLRRLARRIYRLTPEAKIVAAPGQSSRTRTSAAR